MLEVFGYFAASVFQLQSWQRWKLESVTWIRVALKSQKTWLATWLGLEGRDSWKTQVLLVWHSQLRSLFTTPHDCINHHIYLFTPYSFIPYQYVLISQPFISKHTKPALLYTDSFLNFLWMFCFLVIIRRTFDQMQWFESKFCFFTVYKN